jgi:hypothetical protein
MGDQRALDAVSRIERALSRIETAARRPPPAGNGGDSAELVRDAHRKLRSRVEGAIGQIDRLLETGGR